MSLNNNEKTMPQDYWYIEGKAYDLSNFEHPGGPVALSMGKGRDATQLVYSYHPFSQSHRAMLKKYLVKSENDCVSSALAQGDVGQTKLHDYESLPFVWTQEGSPFFNELRQRVKERLAGRKYADATRWVQIFCMICVVLALFPSFISGSWFSLFAFPLAYWVFGVNTFHDASHFSMHKNWRINHFLVYLSPAFSSPFTWYHQHVIGHHVYTNTHQDPDMHHGKKFWRYSPDRKYRSFFKYQMYYVLLIWSQVTMFLAFLLDTSFFVRGHYESIRMIAISQPRKLLHFAGRVFTFGIIYVWPFFMSSFSWSQAFAFSIVPYAIYSACFSFSSQLNHICEENMHGKVYADWYQHQVATSHSFAPKSIFWFIFTGGLNLQIEHHLFPGINAWHLRDVQPIVQDVCQKHGVAYNLSNTVTEAVGKHLRHLSKMSEDPNEKKQM